jgi:hypothetical protein
MSIICIVKKSSKKVKFVFYMTSGIGGNEQKRQERR